jgi:hypothetical protein
MAQVTPSPSSGQKGGRLNRLEIAGFALLGLAVLQNQFRRRTATITMRAYTMKRKAAMSFMPPGMTTALIARALLERGSRPKAPAAKK